MGVHDITSGREIEPTFEPQEALPAGGGGNMGGMEARVARLESDVDHIKRDLTEIKALLRGHDVKFDAQRDRMERDFRLLFGALIAVALGLAGLLAKGFQWL